MSKKQKGHKFWRGKREMSGLQENDTGGEPDAQNADEAGARVDRSLDDDEGSDTLPFGTPGLRLNKDEAATPALGTRTTASVGGGSDTIQMSSISKQLKPNLTTKSKPVRPKPRPRPKGADRVTDMPRRDYSARHRFGFIWYVMGFFGLIFRSILVTVIVMGLSGWIGYNAMRFYIKTPETTVPNVRGMKVDAALDQLSRVKLGMVQERAETSGLVAPGEIINQAPLPGTRIKEKADVRVVVSSGQSSFVVPSVVGETQDNAINKIKSSRMEVGNITEFASDKPKGTVVTQSPDANKGFEKPQKVDLLISKGQ